jgi:hypothetical protein
VESTLHLDVSDLKPTKAEFTVTVKDDHNADLEKSTVSSFYDDLLAKPRADLKTGKRYHPECTIPQSRLAKVILVCS